MSQAYQYVRFLFGTNGTMETDAGRSYAEAESSSRLSVKAISSRITMVQSEALTNMYVSVCEEVIDQATNRRIVHGEVGDRPQERA